MDKNKKNLQAIGLFVLVIVGTVILIELVGLGFNFITNKFANNQNIVATSTSSNLQPTPYDEKNLMNSKVIVDNFSNSAPNKTPTAKSKVTLSVTGQISSGYLYVVASADGKALQTTDPNNFDDVYANLIKLTDEGTPDSRNNGGHLVASASLQTPSSPNQTELLYSLNSIGYIGSYTYTKGKLITPQDITWSNWLSVLNDTAHKDELESYSSTEKQGVIEKLIIYYTCAASSNCSIDTN